MACLHDTREVARSSDDGVASPDISRYCFVAAADDGRNRSKFPEGYSYSYNTRTYSSIRIVRKQRVSEDEWVWFQPVKKSVVARILPLIDSVVPSQPQ